MALYPYEIDPVRLNGIQQPLPEIYVFNRSAFSSLPVIFDPVLYPALIEGVHKVLGIAVQIYEAGPVQGLYACNSRHQLHPVIGGADIALREFLFMDRSVVRHIP